MFKRTRRVESAPTGSDMAVADATPSPANTQAPNASSAAAEATADRSATVAAMSSAELPAKQTVEIDGVVVKSKVQAVIVDPDADLSRFRQLPDTDRSDQEFFAKNWKGEKTVVYALFMRQRFPFWPLRPSMASRGTSPIHGGRKAIA